MPDARENPTHPIVCAGAVVFRDEEVLLIRRGKAPREDEWSIPGGRQELGETIAEAAVREVREETGLEVSLGPLLDVVNFIDRTDEDSVRFHYTLVDFVADATGGDLKAATDARDARFFSLEEALTLPLWEETRRIIGMAADHKRLR